MVSVASGGTADRIVARILFNVLRAGSGTRARYSSTFLGGLWLFAAELRWPDFTLSMGGMLQDLPLQVQAPGQESWCNECVAGDESVSTLLLVQRLQRIDLSRLAPARNRRASPPLPAAMVRRPATAARP